LQERTDAGHAVRLGEGLGAGSSNFVVELTINLLERRPKKAVNSKIVNVVVTLIVRLVEAAKDVVTAAIQQRRSAERSRQLMSNQITCGSQPPHHCHPCLNRSARRSTLSAEGNCSLPRRVMDHSVATFTAADPRTMARSETNSRPLDECASVPRGFDFDVKVV
jgi:hypothetical protein